jgi:hypothetical protein
VEFSSIFIANVTRQDGKMRALWFLSEANLVELFAMWPYLALPPVFTKAHAVIYQGRRRGLECIRSPRLRFYRPATGRGWSTHRRNCSVRAHHVPKEEREMQKVCGGGGSIVRQDESPPTYRVGRGLGLVIVLRLGGAARHVEGTARCVPIVGLRRSVTCGSWGVRARVKHRTAR